MESRPSERVILQRLRNRTIEALDVLAQGDDGVRVSGNADYINGFFDWIDDRAPWGWREWSTLTPDEVSGLGKVHQMLADACEQTPRVCSDDEFISSGWPERIKPVAAEVVALMRDRGVFDEEHEEDEPSIRQ